MARGPIFNIIIILSGYYSTTVEMILVFSWLIFGWLCWCSTSQFCKVSL